MTPSLTREIARWVAVCAILAAAAIPSGGQAQETQSGAGNQTDQTDQEARDQSLPASAQTVSSPSSGIGGWAAEVDPAKSDPGAQPGSPEDQAGSLSPEELELVQRINAYLNGLKHLEGTFIQINHNNKKSHGKFYVRRPGLLRFDYAPPSKMRVVSDGEYLSIEDHDLNTVDQFPLDSTPFRILLDKNVNLLRDANILAVKKTEDTAMIALEDRAGEAAGRLKLFFKLPEIQLDEWVITDAQGLNTRIKLADLVRGKEISKEFFNSTPLEFRNLGMQ